MTTEADLEFGSVRPDGNLEILSSTGTHHLSPAEALELARAILHNLTTTLKPAGQFYLVRHLLPVDRYADEPTTWYGTVVDYGDACGSHPMRKIGDKIYFRESWEVGDGTYAVHSGSIVAYESTGLVTPLCNLPEKPLHWMAVGETHGPLRKLPAMLFDTEETFIRASEILRGR